MQRDWLCLVAAFVLVGGGDVARGQVSFEPPPVDYLKARPNDPIVRLQKRIDDGEVTLVYDESHGYLKSLLELLKVPESSQALV